MKTIGEMTSRCRRLLFMTQEQFASEMELSQGNVSKIERGLRNFPRQKLQWLADTLGVSLDRVQKAWQKFNDQYGGEVE